MRPRRPDALGSRLLLGQLLVVLAGATTLLATALSVGPEVFRHHVREALGAVPPDVGRHLDEAFGTSTLLSLGIATAVATITAVAISVFVARRLVAPIRTVAASADTIARGAYSQRVPRGGPRELDALAASFNAMAASLDRSEERRRELLADVAHELRTPLATVEAYVEGLADGVLPVDAEAWAAIETEIRRLRRLADDLQRVSRAEERQLDLRLAETAPGQLVGAATQAAAPRFAAKGVALESEVARWLPAVLVDTDRLAEVLANLLDNALRHTPASGHVTVRAEREADGVVVTVEDTGEGIAPEHVERVFERFFRADAARSRAAGGSGIGLAVARAIVEAHGGTIEARSAGPGTGAAFVISLPPAARTMADGRRVSPIATDAS